MTSLDSLLQKKTLLAAIRELLERERTLLHQALAAGENHREVWKRFTNNIALLRAKARTILTTHE